MRFATLPLALVAAHAAAAAPAGSGCLSDCTPRIGIVSAFGQEATILVRETRNKRTWVVNGNRYTTGTLRGNKVAIVLSGVSMINSAMVTQSMLDHFRIERLIMSGIAGGVNPAHHVGDVLVPERWAMPMEVYWNVDNSPPGPCGAVGDVSCLGLKLATVDGRTLPPFQLAASAPTGLFIRENHLTSRNAPGGEFRFDYEVDPAMLDVARRIRPELQRCGPNAGAATGKTSGEAGGDTPELTRCVATRPQLVVGGRGVSGTAFLANPAYRTYLFEVLQAQVFEMETAALAHVARANAIPYIAFRSLSDLAGGVAFSADVTALFSSGLAEQNEAAVTLAFLEAWARRRPGR